MLTGVAENREDCGSGDDREIGVQRTPTATSTLGDGGEGDGLDKVTNGQ